MTPELLVAIIAAVLSPAVAIVIFRMMDRRRIEERERQQDRAISDLRTELITQLGEMSNKLTMIESRLEVEEKYRDERWSNLLMRVQQTVYEYCQQWCPYSPSMQSRKKPLRKPEG